jgi:glutaredoxin-related protein
MGAFFLELKKYSNWPTYPQLYVNGELVGGLDIVKELIETKEFESMVPREKDLNSRLKELVESAPLMIFIKGTPEQPKCGFSSQLLQLLKEKNFSFSSFDILSNEEVRQGMCFVQVFLYKAKLII